MSRPNPPFGAVLTYYLKDDLSDPHPASAAISEKKLIKHAARTRRSRAGTRLKKSAVNPIRPSF